MIRSLKKSILITAVSGSGKTTTCKALSELGYPAYDIESMDGLFQWRDDKTDKPIAGDYQDDVSTAKAASWICDRDRLKEILDKQKPDVAFYCGAGSNMDDIWDLFDQVIILQVSDKTTIKRLSSRTPDQYGYTPEVQEYVMSWKGDLEREWLDKGAVSVSAEDSPRKVAEYIVSIT